MSENAGRIEALEDLVEEVRKVASDARMTDAKLDRLERLLGSA